MSSCIICLKNPEIKETIEIFSDQGKRFRIADIVKQHFWFYEKLLPEDLENANCCVTCWWKIENFHFFFCHIRSLYKIEENADPKEPEKEIPTEIKLEPKDNELEQSDLSINKILNELITSNLELNEMDSELGEVVLFPDVADDKIPQSPEKLAEESEVLAMNGMDNEEEVEVIHEIVIDDEDEETEFVIQLQEDECLDPATEIPPLFEINSKLMGDLEFEDMETQIVIDMEEDEPTQDQENQEKPEPEEKDSKIFKYCSRICEFCEFEFLNFKDVKNHYKDSHQVNGFLRCCTNKKFFKKFSLYEHILSHDNPRIPDRVIEQPKEPAKQKSYECEICHQVFLFEKHLKLHCFKAHKIDVKKVFDCTFCDRYFHTKLAQKSHIDQEHLRKNSCPICKLNFLNKILLNQHLKLHKNAKVKGTS